MSGRVRLMTNLPSVSLIALMRKYLHLPALLFSHTQSVELSFALISNSLSPIWHSAAPFCLSDKLFGKRLLQARHYIMSRKSWLKMVPTENCDILMTFSGKVSSSLSSLCVLWWIPPSWNACGGQPDTWALMYSLGTIKFHPFVVPLTREQAFLQYFYGSCSCGLLIESI